MAMTNSLEREHVKKRNIRYHIKDLFVTLYSDTAHPVKCGGRCFTHK
jgi:hypothetical protein